MKFIQDYKESFCNYLFYQPKELWQYEAALFYCDEDVIRAYMLRELKNSSQKSRESFVTVDKVADARMEELEAVYPVLHVEKAKAADEHFKRFIQSVFNKNMISSVFLTGDGFENNWYPNSLRVLKECYLEPGLKEAKPFESFQFVRNGYFCVDCRDSEPGKPVFNRIVSLKSSFKLPK